MLTNAGTAAAFSILRICALRCIAPLCPRRPPPANSRLGEATTILTQGANAISELQEFQNSGIFDYASAMEFISCFHGAALVACQKYAVGTVADINKIRRHKGQSEFGKLALYKEGRSDPDKYGFVELINALANYFKHHDEWDGWPSNETVRALRQFGIDESSDFPLNVGVNIIVPEGDDLRSICRVLEDWRFWLLEKYC